MAVRFDTVGLAVSELLSASPTPVTTIAVTTKTFYGSVRLCGRHQEARAEIACLHASVRLVRVVVYCIVLIQFFFSWVQISLFMYTWYVRMMSDLSD